MTHPPFIGRRPPRDRIMGRLLRHDCRCEGQILDETPELWGNVSYTGCDERHLPTECVIGILVPRSKSGHLTTRTRTHVVVISKGALDGHC
jgi:hypothetical protein